tara:strand:- start:1352 stop:2023 length:672 start_codon:yes stop_codon:yes gene_type:complete
MGMISSEVSYGFGQMGSATCQTATPVIPPQGMVIMAIQFLNGNTPTVLESEDLGNHGPQFINTVSGANFEGVTQSNDATVGAGAGSNTAAGVAITITANAAVKKGQYVLMVDDEQTAAVGMGTAATGAGDGVDPTTVTPVYNGDNPQGTYVTSVNAAGTSITLSTDVTFDAAQHLVFLDNYHGAGGNDADGIKYPTGLTIYGRWTKVIPEADADGGIICYFGN